MEQNLITALAPKLKELDKGGYSRGYRSGGSIVPTSIHQLLKRLLDGLKVPYEQDVPAGKDSKLRADFSVNGILVFVDKKLALTDQRALAAGKREFVVINRDAFRSDGLDHGIRVL